MGRKALKLNQKFEKHSVWEKSSDSIYDWEQVEILHLKESEKYSVGANLAEEDEQQKLEIVRECREL